MQNISRVLLGHQDAVSLLVRCLLAGGHALIEDVPGVGKTVLAQALARSVACAFSRVQLTPDTLPADLLGVSIYDRERAAFVFKPGPIFTHILLADEINRTPPRTQSALLEVMAEGTVSVEGKTHTLEEPFMVVATQNPHDAEGTYPLPENQLDRFLVRFSLGYPEPADERRVLRERPSNGTLHSLPAVVSKDDLVRMRREVDAVRCDDAILDDIVRLARASREHRAFIHGVSPRGALALAQAARATAYVAGRDYVTPDDVRVNWLPVCGHRVLGRSGSEEETREALKEIARRVPSPT
jgi:MoxR-like ATPase